MNGWMDGWMDGWINKLIKYEGSGGVCISFYTSKTGAKYVV